MTRLPPETETTPTARASVAPRTSNTPLRSRDARGSRRAGRDAGEPKVSRLVVRRTLCLSISRKSDSAANRRGCSTAPRARSTAIDGLRTVDHRYSLRATVAAQAHIEDVGIFKTRPCCLRREAPSPPEAWPPLLSPLAFHPEMECVARRARRARRRDGHRALHGGGGCFPDTAARAHGVPGCFPGDAVRVAARGETDGGDLRSIAPSARKVMTNVSTTRERILHERGRSPPARGGLARLRAFPPSSASAPRAPPPSRHRPTRRAIQRDRGEEEEESDGAVRVGLRDEARGSPARRGEGRQDLHRADGAREHRRAGVAHRHDRGDEKGLIADLADQDHRPALHHALQELAGVRHRRWFSCRLGCTRDVLEEDARAREIDRRVCRGGTTAMREARKEFRVPERERSTRRVHARCVVSCRPNASGLVSRSRHRRTLVGGYDHEPGLGCTRSFLLANIFSTPRQVDALERGVTRARRSSGCSGW